MIFLLDPLQGSSLQVEILSISLSICLSVITSNSFPYLDSKLTQLPPVDLGHTTSPMVSSNVPHSCLPCPPVNWSPFPVNWSRNVKDHITDLFHLGSSYVSTFFTSDPEQYFDEENKSLHLLWIVGSLYSKLFMLPRVLLCVIYSLVEKPD